MIRCSAFAAAFLCLLCPRVSSSQVVATPNGPLPATVTIEANTLVRRKLIGMTPATYRQLREVDSLLQVAHNARVAGLLRDSLLAAQQQRVYSDELRRCRASGVVKDEDYTRLAALAVRCEATPKARPLLLDSNTYLGGLVGAAAVVALKLFFHL